MPLDNTAKMSDIISALQTMEGINAKADLASVIGSPAQDADTMATLVNLIQGSKNELAIKMDDGSTGAEPLQTLVGNLFVGKKWASGTVKVSSFTESFRYAGSTEKSSVYSVTVSGLSFEPSLIFIQTYAGAIMASGIYNKDSDGNYGRTVKTFASGTWQISGQVNHNFKADISPAYVDNSGFKLPLTNNMQIQGISASWIAFE